MAVTEESLYLCWVDGDGVAAELQLASGSTVIGRSSACDLVLNDSAVSREHARVDVDGDSVTVRDLESRNGTWVNGARAESATLNPGDEVGIGRVTLVLMSF